MKELLTSQNHAGVWHALYPTATMTLCSKPVLPPTIGGKLPPTCGLCSKLARRLHRIDGSMPDHWLPEAQAA